MRPTLISLFSLLCLGLSPFVSYAQWSIGQETSIGPEKLVVQLSIKKQLNDVFDLGGYFKGGSFIDHRYSKITAESLQKFSLLPPIESYSFPYASINVSHGSTNIKMIALGAFLNLNQPLNNRKKDWFFLRFNIEGGPVEDHYSLRMFSSDTEDFDINSGVFKFFSIGVGTRAGYKRFLDKKNRFSAEIALGLSYYHPNYYDKTTVGYDSTPPFVGVETELSVGFGYLFKY
jgi:hypothetical protein